jgi:hypothetical protein
MKNLPLDLVPLIFDHVRDVRDALCRFALVHTSWSLSAQRLLFETVTIGSLPEWKRIMSTLMSSPYLRPLVQELVWSAVRPWSEALSYHTHVPELLPNVTKLTFEGEVVIDQQLMSALPSLETLVIRCDYAWFNELHVPPPVEIALWPSRIRSVHIEQSSIDICSIATMVEHEHDRKSCTNSVPGGPCRSCAADARLRRETQRYTGFDCGHRRV